MRNLFLFIAFFSLMANCRPQAPAKTANDAIPPFQGSFGYGTNMGYYPPHYYDMELAALAHGTPDGKLPGVGVTTIRPGLYAHFLEEWGYDIRKKHFKFYDSIGLKDNVVILGFPSKEQRDPSFYCPGVESEVFKDLYEPIWDSGENGTPVNEKNPYALYVWKAVKMYGPHVKYWEVWNEPDLDMVGNAWKEPGMDRNWWENIPTPCETKLRAPIYFYVRMLRISYEIIKTLEPTDYVCVGGLGYPSYLNLIMRFTDNPFDGSETSRYPLKGGAYFDVMSYHSYPHIDNSLRTWDNSKNGFRYFRHSDAAIDGVWKQADQFDKVLKKYGYDGKKYPEKEWLITEVNIPRKAFGDFIGSDAAQTHFMIKTLITAQMRNVRQVHIYSLADEVPEAEANNEFSFMGLFKNLKNTKYGQGDMNSVASGYKATSDLLRGKKYNANLTAQLKLPPNIRGGVFTDKSANTVYALWAVTDRDMDENATAMYTFPASMGLNKLEEKKWRSGSHVSRVVVDASEVRLGSSPSFFTATVATERPTEKPTIYPNPLSDGQGVLDYGVFEDGPVSAQIFAADGRMVQNLMYQEFHFRGPHQLPIDLTGVAPGVYFIRLTTQYGFTTLRMVR